MTDWIKEDLQHNWHPYTQMKDCQETKPILIERAQGVKLYDDQGNFYYDTIAS
jgi:adenosylmethionine-8-amino-7-oxononanoate aminotransferase